MTAAEAPDRTPAPHRRRRGILLAVAVAAVLLLAACAWLVFRALQTKGDLERAVATSATLGAAVESEDLDGVRSRVQSLADDTAVGDSLAADPVWRLAELVPGVGANLTGARVAAQQVHRLVVDVAEPLIDVAADIVDGTKPEGALLDVQALAASRHALADAREAVHRASDELTRLDPAAMIPQVADGVEKLTGVVAGATSTVDALADAATVMPTMLGAEGERTILVMLQNNAELRTGGGITGTFIEVHADDGRLSITSQADSSNFPVRAREIVAVPASTTSLYGTVVGRYVQDTSITPDFALTADLVSAWWQEFAGHRPDAVISVDPIVLQAVLGVIGPVEIPHSQISAENLIQKLLVEPYLTMSPDGQTAVFHETVGAVFARLTGTDVDPLDLAQALATPIADGRISAWSAHDDEESILSRTTFAGPAVRQQQAGGNAYAVYFNDTTGGKMDTFLGVRISGGVGSCRSDGRPTTEISVTLTNTAPADAGTAFPGDMTGGWRYGIAPGHIGTTVAVSAPPDAFVGGTTVDGERAAQVDATDAGFTVSAYSVDLAPGESTTLSFRFDVDTDDDATPVVLHTPLVTSPEVTTHTVACG